MKKLTTLFILVFLSVTFFAEPKVPKYYYGDSDKKENAFIYISNDLMYCYEVLATNNESQKFNYQLTLKKKSLNSDIGMNLIILFENEKQLDNFTKSIHLSDIENEFNRIRKLIIQNDESPNPTDPKFAKEHFNYKNKPTYIFYEADGTQL